MRFYPHVMRLVRASSRKGGKYLSISTPLAEKVGNQKKSMLDCYGDPDPDFFPPDHLRVRKKRGQGSNKWKGKCYICVMCYPFQQAWKELEEKDRRKRAGPTPTPSPSTTPKPRKKARKDKPRSGSAHKSMKKNEGQYLLGGVFLGKTNCPGSYCH